MLTINCSVKSCKHRADCRIVTSGGRMTPRIKQTLTAKVTFNCLSETITRGKPKKQVKTPDLGLKSLSPVKYSSSQSDGT